MPFISRRPEVGEDLIDIWLRIAYDNPRAADEVLDAIQITFENLATHPRMGMPYPTQNPELQGILYFPAGNYPDYLIFYFPMDSGIDVVRVLHRARNLITLL